MKNILLLSFLVISIVSQAQSNSSLQSLKEIYANQVAWEDAGELTYSEEEKAIFVKSYRIPVSVDTQLKFDKKKGNVVIFALQNNTAITDVKDPAFKRAYFEMPFKNKDAAVSFITFFNKLAAGK